MVRMAGNVGVDWALGMIPWVGAIPDLFLRSLLPRADKRHLDKHHPETGVIEADAKRVDP